MCVQNALNSNSKIRWLFEDDLGWTEQQLRQVRSSFLLLLDSGNHVKILTENYQPPNEFVDPPSTAQFYMKNENIPGLQHSRFEELWNKGREVPNPWKYLLTIK